MLVVVKKSESAASGITQPGIQITLHQLYVIGQHTKLSVLISFPNKDNDGSSLIKLRIK